MGEKTYACSTVRVNRKGLPPCSSRKLKKGEKVVAQKDNLVFTKWHDKQDVSVLSTNCDLLDPPQVSERRNPRGGLLFMLRNQNRSPCTTSTWGELISRINSGPTTIPADHLGSGINTSSGLFLKWFLAMHLS